MNSLNPIKPINSTEPTESLAAEQRSRGLRLFALLVVAMCFAVGLGFGTDSETLQSWFTQAGTGGTTDGAPNQPNFWILFAFFWVGLVLVSLVLPKTVLSLTAGALFGTWYGVILISLISVASAAINFAIGRWCLNNWLQQKLTRSAAGRMPPLWAIATRDMAAEAGYGVHLLFRFASIPSMLINYFMGAVGARAKPFMVAAVVGVLPQCLWVHGGALATDGNEAPSTLRIASSVISILAAIAIAVIVPRKVMQRIEKLHDRRQSDSTSPDKPSEDYNQ